MAKSIKKEEVVVENTIAEEVVVENTIAEEVVVENTTVEEIVDNTPPHVNVEPDVVDVPKKLGKTKGVVVDCNALRLREGANIKSKELSIIPVGKELEINLDNSTQSFYEVTYDAGSTILVGFCLKDFIKLG